MSLQLDDLRKVLSTESDGCSQLMTLGAWSSDTYGWWNRCVTISPGQRVPLVPL